jgi:5-methyltetrahydropteroyltriglutamate--homocysteine methyltransferase
MRLSTDSILTTHVGSLPRPDELLDLLEANETTEVDPAVFNARVAEAIDDIVARQVESGVDVVSDGENSKISYTFYVRHRLAGIGTVPPTTTLPVTAQHADLMDHPDLMALNTARGGATSWMAMAAPPACVGPVSYANLEPLHEDLAHFRAAVDKNHPKDAFMNAASPGVLTKFVPDLYYNDEDAYVGALADALAVEYEAIVAAGFILQIDAPDFGSARHNQYQHLSDEEFLKIAERNMEAVNHATRNIPRDRMRMHVCWGNYEGPHTHDIPLRTLWPVLLKARPQGLLFEAANPAHAHEWEDLKTLKIQDDTVLIPGVIDSTSNFVENPRLVAQRILQFTDIVGRERVIAGSDCGFATFAGADNPIAPSVVWAKMRAMAAGAALASERLWP